VRKGSPHGLVVGARRSYDSIDTLSPHVRDGLELFGSHLESHCSLLNESFDDTSSNHLLFTFICTIEPVCLGAVDGSSLFKVSLIFAAAMGGVCMQAVQLLLPAIRTQPNVVLPSSTLRGGALSTPDEDSAELRVAGESSVTDSKDQLIADLRRQLVEAKSSGGSKGSPDGGGKCLVDAKRRHMRMFDMLRLANYDCQSKGKLIDSYKDAVVVEVGSYLGEELKQFIHAKKVYTFEPTPAKKARIMKAIKKRNMENIVEFHQAAITDKTGTVKLHLECAHWKQQSKEGC
ncbi:hypothetical protein FOZ62_001848, partial [Perkinsus olseni]